MAIPSGTRLGPYQIDSPLGAGGMGEVYRARDVRLDRTVAIKVLPAHIARDPQFRERFEHEARTVSALNHPHICTLYDVGHQEGIDFLVVEYVDGEGLDRRIRGQGLPVPEVLHFGIQIAAALGAAHAAGIVHRDVKPANIMVSRGNVVKILDFGLAKSPERGSADPEAVTRSLNRTRPGSILGTVAYMSPEQAEGKPTDVRSDVFSLGAVLYEMLAGRRPFEGDSDLLTLSAILRDAPQDLKSLRPEIPDELERIVLKCLAKDRDARYGSAGEVHAALQALQIQLAVRALPGRGRGAPRFAVAALIILLAGGPVAGWWWFRGSNARWARNVAVPEIARLLDQEKYLEALRLAREAQRHMPGDPQIGQLVRSISYPMSVRTDPPGALVSIKEYGAVNAEWERLGSTPLDDIRIPYGYLRFRAEKNGFDTLEVAVNFFGVVQLALDRTGTAPDGMVRVARGPYRTGSDFVLDGYWIDKYEVTNREFKKFVDAGGYERREYWKHPFMKDGRKLAWKEAIREFRDVTGRQGPSTWQLGTYPEGRGDFPVSGVSWYEAAAYAEFAGKSLPTVYHWYRAAIGYGAYSEILSLSNFSGKGPASVGSHQGLGPFGTYDMAGNVKEWCWNETGNRRVIRGGAWSDASYMSYQDDALPAFDRSATNGFRCAKYTGLASDAARAPVERLARDYKQEKPVVDEIFRVYQSLYAYERSDLKPRIESAEESEHWRKERISFDAAYSGERVVAYLFTPKNANPPYQTVVYFPTSMALMTTSIDAAEMLFVDFLMQSGRAVMYPIYKGTYERRLTGDAPQSLQLERELMLSWSKDLGRSIDYLQTRSDIDATKLAFYGFSLGARYGPLLTALEPRLKVSVLLAGGFVTTKLAPEVDPMNFAPRARIPVLMLNGRDDFLRPVEISQVPMFRLLGAPSKDKRHVLYDSGHIPPRIPVIKETLEWLDRYLGPV